MRRLSQNVRVRVGGGGSLYVLSLKTVSTKVSQCSLFDRAYQAEVRITPRLGSARWGRCPNNPNELPHMCGLYGRECAFVFVRDSVDGFLWLEF